MLRQELELTLSSVDPFLPSGSSAAPLSIKAAKGRIFLSRYILSCLLCFPSGGAGYLRLRVAAWAVAAGFPVSAGLSGPPLTFMVDDGRAAGVETLDVD